MNHRSRLQAAALLLLLLLHARPTHAWGKQGHEVVGNLAWALLSNETQATVAALLLGTAAADDDPSSNCQEYCSPLARVSDWADRARYSKAYHWSAPLHYIDVRDDDVPGGCPAAINTTTTTTSSVSSCQFNYTRDCPDDICVAGAIVNYTNRAAARNGSAGDDERLRRESLMFLTHFIGDIHQPLHCARQTDRGGNSIHVKFLNDTSKNTGAKHHNDRDYARTAGHSQVRTSRRRRRLRKSHHHELNLHAVWDDSIIETTLARDYNNSRNALELSLLNLIWQTRLTPAWNNEWLRCANGALTLCATQWGKESWRHAMRYAYRNVDGTEVVDGTELTDGRYYETRLPVVRERLAVAGVRLAWTLELNLNNNATTTQYS